MEAEEFEETCRILGDIAARFPSQGCEVAALRKAADALLFVYSDGMKQRFLEFMRGKDQPLTPAQILHLRAIGIDPDMLTDEEDDGSGQR